MGARVKSETIIKFFVVAALVGPGGVASADQLQGWITVTEKPRADVRAEPRETSRRVGSLAANAQTPWYQRSEQWYRVVVDGRSGWVHEGHVEETAPEDVRNRRAREQAARSGAQSASAAPAMPDPAAEKERADRERRALAKRAVNGAIMYDRWLEKTMAGRGVGAIAAGVHEQGSSRGQAALIENQRCVYGGVADKVEETVADLRAYALAGCKRAGCKKCEVMATRP